MTSLSCLSVLRRVAPCCVLFLALAFVAGCSPYTALGGKNQAAMTTPATQLPRKETSTPIVSPAPRTELAPIIGPEASLAAQTASPQLPVPVSPSIAGGGTKIALLVPLTGRGASLGQAMINAAQQAVFDVGSGGFELMTRDTGSNPKTAAKAAQDAINAGAQLLVGPLFAADVAAVKPIVQTSSVNMLALSTDVSLAEPGVYVMGFAPAPQVERVVSYAASRGLKRFAALIPSGPYGSLVSKAFTQAVHDAGGEVVTIESPTNLTALATKKDQIDALLLPFGGTELRKMAGQLTAAGLNHGHIRWLGTGLWDEPGLAKGQPELIGGWYAAAEADARESFTKAYESTYNAQPPRLATLAYDATALAAALVRSGQRFDRTAITNASGFAGLDGIFRFAQDGQIQRGLAVQEVTATDAMVIDASPRTFVSR